jgi:hypothetical protein
MAPHKMTEEQRAEFVATYLKLIGETGKAFHATDKVVAREAIRRARIALVTDLECFDGYRGRYQYLRKMPPKPRPSGVHYEDMSNGTPICGSDSKRTSSKQDRVTCKVCLSYLGGE